MHENLECKIHQDLVLHTVNIWLTLSYFPGGLEGKAPACNTSTVFFPYLMLTSLKSMSMKLS